MGQRAVQHVTNSLIALVLIAVGAVCLVATYQALVNRVWYIFTLLVCYWVVMSFGLAIRFVYERKPIFEGWRECRAEWRNSESRPSTLVLTLIIIGALIALGALVAGISYGVRYVADLLS